MKTKYFTHALINGLLALLCTLPAAAANLAGTAVFVSGKPTATGAAGNVRELKSGDKLYSGALLETHNGRVQIKFVDGAFISVQPNSRFQVEDYNYANESDGSEKAVYNLFKGGMRALTGAIGKKHPDAYKVKTPVATIGIRGSGHNTRICSGDCTGSNGLPLPDGLYHTTWKDATYVETNAGVTEVPFLNSVYVQDIDSPAEQTNQASEVTAVQPLDSVEELVEEQGEEVVIEEGEELKCIGDDVCLPESFASEVVLTLIGESDQTGLTQLPNQSLLGIETNLYRGEFDYDNADGGILTTATVYVGEDSAGTNGLAGVYGMEIDEDDSGQGMDEPLELLITIDPDGIGATTGPARDLLDAAKAFNAGEHLPLIDGVAQNPATVVPGSHVEGIVGSTNYEYGRLTEGQILFVDRVLDGPNAGVLTVEVDDLPADQYFLYLNGDAAATNFGVGATGTYTLLVDDNGTASTDTHDGFVGNGVQSGSLAIDFTSLNGTINMTVDHDTLYTVAGGLKIYRPNLADFEDGFDGVTATTNVVGTCDGGCETIIDGSFFGGLESPTGADGAPVLAGLDYEIITVPFDGETGNSIIGNAVFERSGTAAPIPDTFTVMPDQGLVLVLPNLDPDPLFPDEFADIGLFYDATNIVGDDWNNTRGLVATAGSEIDDDSGEEFFVVATIDPLGLATVDDLDPKVVAAQGLIADALVSDPGLVADVVASPAILEEYFQKEYFQGNGIAWGRWAGNGGNILVVDENIVNGLPGGTKTVEKLTFTDKQSLAFITGNLPDPVLAGATGFYEFIGGTESTTASGATTGQGVIIGSGSINFDFNDPGSGWLDMTVRHLTDYYVSGSLAIDEANPGLFYGNNVTAITTGGNCNAECTTFINGGFAGPLTGGALGSPAFAGLEYHIVDPVDGILGVAAFERTGDGQF